MGNIKDEIKRLRKEKYKEITYNNLAYSVWPAFFVTSLAFTIVLIWRYTLATYETYWSLFIYLVKTMMNMLPATFFWFGICYIVLFIWSTIVDILNYRKIK